MGGNVELTYGGNSLWMLKLCLLTFYTRFVGPLSWGKTVIRTLWWMILVTFVTILIVTLTECRPLHLAWDLAPPGEGEMTPFPFLQGRDLD